MSAILEKPCAVTLMDQRSILDHLDPLAVLIAKAQSRGLRLFSTGDVLHRLYQGDWQCWGAFKDSELVAVCITSVEQFPLARMFCVEMIAGDLDDGWMRHFPMLEAWAKERGCSYAQVYGRRGWKRFLPARYVHERDVWRTAL